MKTRRAGAKARLARMRRARTARAWRERRGRAARAARTLARAGADRGGRAWGRFLDRFHALELSENVIMLGFAVLIGLAGAFGVIAFYRTIDLAFGLFYEWTGYWLGEGVRAVYRPIITAAGLTAAWAMQRSLRGREGGENVAAVQLAMARRQGEVPARPAFVRTAAAAVTLGAGGSAGSEGPVAVLGAAVGSAIGRLFRFDPSRVKAMVGAGAAAGIAASFNAPLAGAFFALEEIVGSVGAASFSPVVVSSVVAALVSRSVLGDHPAFPIPHAYGFALRREVFVFYPLLGLVAGLVAVLYIRAFFGAQRLAERVPGPQVLRPILGGVVVGLTVWLSGGLLVGYGHLAVRLDVFGRMALGALALLVVGKIFVTSVTMGFGGTGGVFTPSLYLGAATGGAFGVALAGLFPGLRLHPEAYALVGMGAMVAAATGAPITAILIVFEMTNDYAIVPPLMLTSVIAFAVARHVEKDNLYSGWLRRRGEHLEHGEDRDVLAGLRVAETMDAAPRTVPEHATVDDMLDHLGRTDLTELPVVDDDGRLLGVVTIAELGRLARDHGSLSALLLAADVAGPTETVAPADSLLDATRRMGVRGSGSLPVVDESGGRLVGVITRAHVLARYEQAVAGARGSHPAG